MRNLIVTHDGSSLSFVELLLQARDAESNIEKVDCVAGPGKPSTASVSFCKKGRDTKSRTRSKTVPIGCQ